MFQQCGVFTTCMENSPAGHVQTVWCVDQLHGAESCWTTNNSVASHKYPPFLTSQRFITMLTCPSTTRQILSAPFLLKIHFNIITGAQSSKWSSSFKFPNQNRLLHCVWQMLCPSYPQSLITYYNRILNLVSSIRVPSTSEACTIPMPLDRLLIA
jgi:hypothetical protein